MTFVMEKKASTCTFHVDLGFDVGIKMIIIIIIIIIIVIIKIIHPGMPSG